MAPTTSGFQSLFSWMRVTGLWTAFIQPGDRRFQSLFSWMRVTGPRAQEAAPSSPSGSMFQSLFSWMRVTGQRPPADHRATGRSRWVVQSLFSWMRVTGPRDVRPRPRSLPTSRGFQSLFSWMNIFRVHTGRVTVSHRTPQAQAVSILVLLDEGHRPPQGPVPHWFGDGGRGFNPCSLG